MYKLFVFIILYGLGNILSDKCLAQNSLPDSMQHRIDTSKTTKVWAYIEVGVYYFKSFDLAGYDKALSYFNLAVIEGKKSKNVIGEANAYLEMANTYYNVGQNLPKALEYYQNFLTKVQFTKDTLVFIRQHINIANTYFKLNKKNECLQELLKAIRLSIKLNNKDAKNRIFGCSAYLHSLFGNIDSASKYLNMVDTTAKIQNGGLPWQSYYIQAKAKVYFATNKQRLALGLLQKQLAEMNTNIDSIAIINDLIEMDKKLGNWQNAYTLSVLVDKMQVKIQNEKAATNINIKLLETDAKLKEENKALLLNKLNNERNFRYWLVLGIVLLSGAALGLFWFSKQLKSENNKLENANNENLLLFKELDHRVKNNLQLMLSMLQLEKNYNSHLPSTLIIENIASKINALASVHEYLSIHKNVQIIQLKSYIENIVNAVLQSFNYANFIDVIIDIDAIEIPVVKTIPLGLITNEIIINSLKYAFEHQTAPRLEINGHKNENDKIVFSIQDNGKGFVKNVAIKSLGLMIIELLAKQINATATLSSINGTKWEFVLNE